MFHQELINLELDPNVLSDEKRGALAGSAHLCPHDLTLLLLLRGDSSGFLPSNLTGCWMQATVKYLPHSLRRPIRGSGQS